MNKIIEDLDEEEINILIKEAEMVDDEFLEDEEGISSDEFQGF